jgi:hypothetical protein
MRISEIISEGRLDELAPSSNPGNGGNYLQALASAWYNGTFNTGNLHRGIKSQEDVERILARGIHCGDGKVRKYYIDYNSDFDGVEIQSHDHYEHSDYDEAGNEVDSRTGRPWGPYDVVAFHGNDLNEGVTEGKQLDEVDFSSGLGELSLSSEQMFNQSTVDGTIGSRKVYLFADNKNQIYFFMRGRKIDALVYLLDGRIMAMKNFSSNKGLIYNLFQYIINIKRQQVRLTPEDKLTSDGIEWIIDQIRRPNGFKINDGSGNKIDASELYKEWENSRITGNAGSTEIVISESKNSKHLRENERRLMPMDIFGSTLKEIDSQMLPRLEMVNILETSQSHKSKVTNQDVTEAELDEAKRKKKRKTKSKRRTSSPNRSPVPLFYGAWGFGGDGEGGDGGGE